MTDFGFVCILFHFIQYGMFFVRVEFILFLGFVFAFAFSYSFYLEHR